MPSVTIIVTDEPAGQVRIDMEGERDYRALPPEEHSPAERCADGAWSELSELARHIPRQLRCRDGSEEDA